MKRPASVENNLARIQSWREICPELTIRSTFIVGFPGETAQDFELLLDFLDEAQLDRVGCFAYSAVQGATANQLPNPVPEELKQERLQQFMLKQAEISAQKLNQKIGRNMQVIVDDIDHQQIIARSSADAPEIDGLVYISAENRNLKPGDMAQVNIIDSTDHDLIAQLVE